MISIKNVLSLLYFDPLADLPHNDSPKGNQNYNCYTDYSGAIRINGQKQEPNQQLHNTIAKRHLPVWDLQLIGKELIQVTTMSFRQLFTISFPYIKSR